MNIQVVGDSKDKNSASDDAHRETKAGKILVQIYEIQTPAAAEKMIELGVDHIGSVVLSMDNWKIPEIRETVMLKAGTIVKSSLIPLYSDPDMIYRTADYYRPDILHCCESLTDGHGIRKDVDNLIRFHEGFKKRFSEIKLMRSIPVGENGKAHLTPTLELASLFEAFSDFFLTDTLLTGDNGSQEAEQPEAGFVGITGKVCDWEMSEKLVEKSTIPVILAGGISPENVYDSILQVNPAGVDSCTNTNVTDKKGNAIRFKKDTEKVKRLIDSVRQAEKIKTTQRK